MYDPELMFFPLLSFFPSDHEGDGPTWGYRVVVVVRALLHHGSGRVGHHHLTALSRSAPEVLKPIPRLPLPRRLLLLHTHDGVSCSSVAWD